MLARRVEPALGRPLLALLGHDAGGVRAVAERDIDHLLGRRHLEIERFGGRDLPPERQDPEGDQPDHADGHVGSMEPGQDVEAGAEEVG